MGAPRLGILGGTFDPIHLGHLILAQAAAEHLGLDRVLFVPAGLQPLKRDRPHTPAPHRVRMVELAIADNPRFALSRADVDHPGPSYTVETLDRLRAAWGPQAAFWFIIGLDSLASLRAWRDPAGLLARTRLAVADRPGVAIDLPALTAALPQLPARLDWIPAPLIAISASDLRARAAAGRSLRYLVPDAVAAYIADHHLYTVNSEQ
jgi:nicotinate-nucleotide adenylyltransferase